MAAGTDWAQVAADYLATRAPEDDVANVLHRLSEIHPLEINEGLDPGRAVEVKPHATAFLLFAIRQAVADHALSDEEVLTLRHLARVFRVQEGDLLNRHREDVRELLCLELERLLEDRAIDPAEAVHKVKLQEVLGPGIRSVPGLIKVGRIARVPDQRVLGFLAYVSFGVMYFGSARGRRIQDGQWEGARPS